MIAEAEYDPEVLVKEREATPDLFPDLSLKLEYPLAIYVPAAVDVATDTPPELPAPLTADDTFVPDDTVQRLIYWWLTNGPKDWRANIVAQETTPPVVPDGPVINPLRYRYPGERYDGVRRTMRYHR